MGVPSNGYTASQMIDDFFNGQNTCSNWSDTEITLGIQILCRNSNQPGFLPSSAADGVGTDHKDESHTACAERPLWLKKPLVSIKHDDFQLKTDVV